MRRFLFLFRILVVNKEKEIETEAVVSNTMKDCGKYLDFYILEIEPAETLGKLKQLVSAKLDMQLEDFVLTCAGMFFF